MSHPLSFPFRLFLLITAAVIVLQPVTVLADKAGDDFSLGVGLWRKERWTPAAETFQQFLKDYPDHPRVPLAHFYLGLCWSSLQKYERSRDHFEEFMRLNPESANAAAARYRIGECSYYLGEYDLAVQQLTDYVRMHPDHKLIEWGNLQLGESLIQLQRWTEADTLLNELLKSSSTEYITSQAQYSLALSLEKQQKSDAAVEAYQRVARLDDPRQASRALARAGTIRFRQQQYDQASTFYDRIVSRYPDSRLAPSAALNSGLALYRVRKYEDALRRFAQVPDDASERTEATLLAGMTLKRLQRIEEARKTLRSAFEAAGDTELAAESLFELARLEQTAGDSRLAADMYGDLIDRWPQDPHTPDALFNAAGLELELKDPDTAWNLLNRLRSDFPEQAAKSRVRFLTGRTLLQRNEPAEAKKALQAVVASDDADARSVSLSLYYIARMDHESRQYQSALRTVRQLRPMLKNSENQDLQGALALGAMSAIELEDFAAAADLATAYLSDDSNTAQAADALAARTVARAGAGDYAAAVQDADRLITLSPDDPQTWTAVLQSAERAWDAKQYEAALQLFQRCGSEPAPSTTRQAGVSGAAWSQFHLKQFEQAAAGFRSVFDTWPDSSVGLEGRYMAARSLQEDGRDDAAIREYISVSRDFAKLATSAETPELRQRLNNYAIDAGRTAARMLDGLERYADSNQQFAELADRLAEAGELDALLDEWAWLNLQSGNFDQADEIYRRLLKERPDSPFAGTARLSLAESDLNAGRTEEAISAFESLVGNDRVEPSEKSKALFHLADVSAGQQDWEKVLRYASQYARAYSTSDLAPRVELLHADALLATGELNKARELLELLRRGVLEGQLERESWTERIWIVLGEVALAEKDYDSVDTIVQEFAENYPESKLQFQIAYIQGRRWKNQPQPDFDKARTFFEQAIFHESGRGTRTAARSQFLIADTYLMQNDYDQASRDYLKVYLLYRYPDLQAQALYQAGGCQQKTGKPQEAIQTWESLIEEFPESPLAKDAADLLNQPAGESPRT